MNGVKSKVDKVDDVDDSERKGDDGRSPAMLEINSNFEEVRALNIFLLMFVSLANNLSIVVCRVNQFHLTSCNLNVYFHFVNLNVSEETFKLFSRNDLHVYSGTI